ncbi:MAG TPA: MFS transporter [Pseudomonas sp.]|nr:MFS transporter [Pseudomonas sp.]
MRVPARPLLFLALLVAAFNLRPGITSVAPLIERMAEELALSRAGISLTTVLPVLFMGLLAPLAPRLALRFGLERVLLGCLVLLVLALLLRVAGASSLVLIGSAGLVGIGVAVAGPLMSGFIKRYFLQSFGAALGWFSLSMSVGGASGVVFTQPLTDLFAGRWTLALAFWALPALIAVLVWWRLPNQREEQGSVPAGGLPWGVSRAWLITGFFALQSGLFYTLSTWLVARYGEAGLTAMRSNGLLSLFMLAGMPCAFAVPWLAHRYVSRPLLLGLCSTLALLSLGMIALAPTLWPELWAVTLGVALSSSFALALILPMYEVQTPIEVSRWTAMMLSVGYCLACLMPLLVGLLRDLSGSYRAPFLVLTLMAAAMLLLTLALRKRG